MTEDGRGAAEAVRETPVYRAFLANWIRSRDAGREAVARTGFVPDEILAAEMAGSRADERYGVNVIARPPESVIARILDLRRGLCRVDPLQYFYPASDLHLTVLEILHGRPRPIDARLLGNIADAARLAVAGMPMPNLVDGRVGFDPSTVTFHTFPSDERLPRLRDRIVTVLQDAGIAFEPRYRSDTAHVTCVRYLTNVRDPAAWRRRLDDLQETVWPIHWDVEAVWITAGATWYGRSERIERFGPFPLRPQ